MQRTPNIFNLGLNVSFSVWSLDGSGYVCCSLPNFLNFCVEERKVLCLQLHFKVKVHDLQLHLFCACYFVPSLDQDYSMVAAG